MDARPAMTLLTWESGAFRAQVLAARLASEGIDAQLRGAVEGPYGFTVGDMARVDVYVPEDQLDDARYVMLAVEVDATLAAPTAWWDAGAQPGPLRNRRWPWWVAVTLIAVAVIGPVLAWLANW